MMKLRTRFLALLVALLALAPIAMPSTASAQVKYSAGRVYVETYTDSSHATQTTAHIKAGIAYALQTGRELFLPAGDYLVTPGAITITDQLVFYGAGEEATRLYAAGAGAVLTVDASLSQSTGKGPNISRLGIYSNRATSATGDIGIAVTNTGSANSAFFTLRDVVVEGTFDIAVDAENTYYAHFGNVYFGQYRRHGLRLGSTHTVDAGDVTVTECTFQSATSGSGGFVSGGSALEINQAPGIRVIGNKFHPHHAIGVHVHPDATFTTEAFPHLMVQIAGNNFDSFGAAGSAVVLEGIYGTGVSGETEHGNKLANVAITDNTLSNTRYLVDIRSEHATTIAVTGNTAGGGGGIRIAPDAVVDGLLVAGNLFDNRTTGATTGAAGSGVGDTTPVKRLGTVSSWKGSGNKYIGFTVGPDMQDSSSTYDVTEATTQLDTSTVTRIPVNVGAWTNTWSVTASTTDTVTWAISGDTAIVDGAQGEHFLHYSGSSAAPKVVAPSGYSLSRRKVDTMPPAVDNLVVGLPWRVHGSIITYGIVRYDTVAALTTEAGGGGGGGSVIFEDSFDTGSGSISGRTPDVTAGPTTWTLAGLCAVDGPGNYAYSEVEATNNGATYDAGSADGIWKVTVNCPSTTVGAFISFNHASFSDNWQIWWRVDNGTTTLYKVVGGSFTAVATTTLTWTADTDYQLAITIDGDDIDIARSGVEIDALDWTESSRPGKTIDVVGFFNGSTGIVKFTNARFESLP